MDRWGEFQILDLKKDTLINQVAVPRPRIGQGEVQGYTTLVLPTREELMNESNLLPSRRKAHILARAGGVIAGIYLSAAIADNFDKISSGIQKFTYHLSTASHSFAPLNDPSNFIDSITRGFLR